MFKKSFFLILYFCFFLLTASTSFAIKNCDLGQCNSEDSNYEQCLKEIRDICLNQKNTLTSQIKALDSQYQLTLLKITQTEKSIATLEKEISGLGVEIGKLEKQIDSLSTTYINQIVQSYKLQKKYPSFAYLFSDNINTFLEQHQYISSIQADSKQNLIDMEKVRYNYDTQKTAKEKKQTELETLQKTLASQKISLNNQKKAKDSLLKVTEDEYTRVQNEITALRKFSSGAGGSACLDNSPSKSGDGYDNYFSQRDKRWCNNPINPNSLCNGSICDNDDNDDIGHIGCAITSYAIILNKKGINITPEEISNNKENFCDNSGNCYSYDQKLLINKLRNGYQSYSTSTVDSELNKGHYVILELSAFGGTHFVVIISGNDGNYKIHDPWYGPNMNLNDKYKYNKKLSIRLI